MTRPVILDATKWLPGFKKPRWLPEVVGGFITDLESDGDLPGAKRLQDALSDRRLRDALYRPFPHREPDVAWPLSLAGALLLPYCRSHRRTDGRHVSRFSRPWDTEVREAYEAVARAADNLESALARLHDLVPNVDAEQLDTLDAMPIGPVSLRGGVLTSALPMLRMAAESQAQRRRYHSLGVVRPSTRPANYQKYRVIVDLKREPYELTHAAVSSIASAALAEAVSVDDVRNALTPRGRSQGM